MPRACAQRRPRAVDVLGARGQPRARAPLGPQHRGARRGPLPVRRVSAGPVSFAVFRERSRCCCCAGTPPTLCRALSAHPRTRSTSRPRRAASTTCTSPSASPAVWIANGVARLCTARTAWSRRRSPTASRGRATRSTPPSRCRTSSTATWSRSNRASRKERSPRSCAAVRRHLSPLRPSLRALSLLTC